MKKPSDHKTKKSVLDENKQQSFNEIEGSHLLKPFSKLKGQDAIYLMGCLLDVVDPALLKDEAVVDTNDIGALVKLLDFKGMATFLDSIEERYVIDTAGWAEFNIPANMDKLMDLMFGYVGELGKGEA